MYMYESYIYIYNHMYIEGITLHTSTGLFFRILGCSRGESDVPSSLFGLLPHLVDPGWTNLLDTPLVH